MPDGWHKYTASLEECALKCAVRPTCVYITRWHDTGDCLLAGAGATSASTSITTTSGRVSCSPSSPPLLPPPSSPPSPPPPSPSPPPPLACNAYNAGLSYMEETTGLYIYPGLLGMRHLSLGAVSGAYDDPPLQEKCCAACLAGSYGGVSLVQVGAV